MTNPRTLLEIHELLPKKSLGQNFIHDTNMLEKIVNTAEIMPDDTVVEIGPGTGAMTRVLASKARHVICVEIDKSLRPVLESELAEFDNVLLVFDDILKVDILHLVGTKPFVVVANVPYYITSKIIRQLLDVHRRPRTIVLTIQYEVAERICAEPGDMSLLAVSVQFYGKPSLVTKVNPAVFWPRPDVDSAILRIDPFDHPQFDVPDSKTFFRVVKAGFSQKRKQLKNSLGGGLGMKSKVAGGLLEDAGIDVKRRAETLTLAEWAALSRVYAASQSS